MKNFYLILLSVFAFLNTAMAQELKVKSFSVAINDLTASVETVPDKNGDPCALVKILLVDSIAKVEGFVLKAKSVSPTEKWVYLSSGAKEVRIMPAHYKPISIYFPNFGVKGVEGKRTYILDLEADHPLVLNQAAMSNSFGLANSQDLNFQEKIKVAVADGDWTSIERMAANGVTVAYYPLAKHYLETKKYQLADTYAQKSYLSGANLDKAKLILQYLVRLGYYDDKEYPECLKAK